MSRGVDGSDAVDPTLAFEDHGADERDGLNAGKGAEFGEDSVVEGGTDFIVFEVVALKIDVGGDDVVDGETLVEGGEVEKAFGEESGEKKEGGAGEDLGSDEPAAEERAAASAGGASGVLQSLQRFDAEKTESGKEAEDRRCTDSEEDGDGEDGEIYADGLSAGDCELGISGETVHGEEGQRDAEDASGYGEEEDFSESALQDAGG